MDNERTDIMPVIWGTAFSALGVIELIKRYEVIYGIPLWAICFFVIAFNNFLASGAVRSRLKLDNPRIIKAVSIANIAAIATLIISLIVEFALS